MFALKKQTKGSKTKQHLYECAIALFQEKGYDQVSVDEIVRDAGTAKGTFYIYFDSKADIIAYMLQEYDHYYDQVEQALDARASVDARLAVIIRSSCDFTQKTIGLDLIRVLYANQLMGTLHQEELYTNRALYRIIRKLVEEGQASGLYSSEEGAETLTNRIVRCIRGTFYEWCLQDGAFDLAEECTRFAAGFCRGLHTDAAMQDAPAP